MKKKKLDPISKPVQFSDDDNIINLILPQVEGCLLAPGIFPTTVSLV